MLNVFLFIQFKNVLIFLLQKLLNNWKKYNWYKLNSTKIINKALTLKLFTNNFANPF